MSTITTEQIKELRELTGISVMQCKKALEEAGGDKEKALLVLREKSEAIAEKKGDRVLGAGVIDAYIHSTKLMGTLIELSCETDFVARNEEFVAIARDIAMHITAVGANDIAELLEQPFIKNPDITIKQLIDGGVQKFGEKIEIARFSRFAVGN